MSKKQIKKIIFMGVGCALLLIVGTIYSLLYNDGRWVKNMDMSEYVFSYKDIPMLVIGALIALYAIYEDELFQENKRKAQLEAYKIGFKLLFVVIWLMAIGMFSRNVEWCAIFMLISVSLIYAIVLFLSNYLLYRYEKRK